MKKSEIKARVSRIVRERLMVLGFEKQKRAKGEVFLQLNDESCGRVGLNTCMRLGPDLMGINPIVVVRHNAMADLENRFKANDAIKGKENLTGTLLKPLGYLTPAKEFRLWEFSGDIGRQDETIDAMIHDIQEYGIPFMRAHSTFDAVGRDLGDWQLIPVNFAVYETPVWLILARRKEAAVAYVRQQLELRKGKDGMEAQVYRKFAGNLLTYADAADAGRGV